MNVIQNPTVQCELERHIITINLISFLGPDSGSIRALIDLMRPDAYEFAGYIRDVIYHEMGAPPQNSGCTNDDLQHDIEELLVKRESRQGNLFLTLLPRLPEPASEEAYVLCAINHRLKLQISNPWTDTRIKLIVACGVALSQRGQLIAYDQRSSLAQHCWRVLDDLERFPRAPIQPNKELKEILSGIKRSEHMSNVGFEDVNKQLSDMSVQLAVIANQQNQICVMLADICNKEGSVGSCQQTAEIDPPCTPDDGQQVPISQLLHTISLGFSDSSHQSYEAPPMERTTIEQPVRFEPPVTRSSAHGAHYN
ncbi:hypothetical protein FBEOM_7895 [Fusarium beomiforme]|uniref:Uncharacterized protein n=1 Tax=Fusarium beomiforme TaxID=44412 RepID=A0A9P5AG82_9HYPO|nr:hypothetical protein FBEOM_7895 [Fusarium beomiforme]